MIARHETTVDKNDIWGQLSAPLPAGVISWRQDGRAVQRDGKYFARFVAYVDANTVRERLDGVVPGEWDLTLDLLPTLGAESDDEPTCSFKARLQILGVIREDVGTGRDYKQAATDAFKRAAVRFGIAHELYAYEQNWVQVDGDGKYARPFEDPADAYARRLARGSRAERSEPALARATRIDDVAVKGEKSDAADTADTADLADTPVGHEMDADESVATGPLASEEPSCPKCGGRMWDNRLSKRNPKAPDYKCRSRSCDGVVWPPRSGPGSVKSEAADVSPAADGTGLEPLPF
ncbi:MAG TPA: Rad52/Rad22 family DNA repair protein [Gemmatimonadaceae bacterium]|nr:Rad52/Rad22 family DNA repair protein [Gemmatimonadaceae bacterium]